jgi:large conductance mechanosensitive channel
LAKHRNKINIKEKLTVVDEFKNFLLRGNVIDLAVGVIIGGAFNKIVTSLVDDVIMPIISIFGGTGNMSERFVALNGQAYASLAEAAEAGAPLMKYGSFIATVLNFLLMGLVIFFLVKFLNYINRKIKLGKPAEEPAAPATTKTCPFCITQIHKDAVVCPNCTRALEPTAV